MGPNPLILRRHILRRVTNQLNKYALSGLEISSASPLYEYQIYSYDTPWESTGSQLIHTSAAADPVLDAPRSRSDLQIPDASGSLGGGAPQRLRYNSTHLQGRIDPVSCVLLIIEELRLSAFQRLKNRRKRISPARDTSTFTYGPPTYYGAHLIRGRPQLMCATPFSCRLSNST